MSCRYARPCPGDRAARTSSHGQTRPSSSMATRLFAASAPSTRGRSCVLLGAFDSRTGPRSRWPPPVARLAQAQLSPAAMSVVTRLLALESGATLESVSKWADGVRALSTASSWPAAHSPAQGASHGLKGNWQRGGRYSQSRSRPHRGPDAVARQRVVSDQGLSLRRR